MKEQSYTKDIIRQYIKKIVLVFKHRHFPFLFVLSHTSTFVVKQCD